MSPVAKRFLCIWFPDWPIQRLRVQRRRESSMDDPIVLWHNDPRTGRVVVACCEKAAAAGLRPTMAISEAVDLLRRQLSGKKRFKDHSHASESLENAGSVKATEPACLIEEHDVAVDYRSLRKLAEWIQDRVSPLVSVETLEKQRWSGMPRHQSESLLCEITGVVHLFGSEAELLHNVKDQLSRFGLTASMAVADSVGAAWAFSHRHLGQQRSGNWLLQVVPKGQSVEMLQDLDVQTLRIQPETVRTLDRLGVTNIGQLFRLPRSGLATRLGDGLVRRMAQATGEIDEPVDVYHRESDVESKHDLEYPTDDVEILSDRIERLVDDVRAGLATTQRGALGLSCRLDLAAHPPLSFKVGLFAPTLDSKHLSTLLINALQYQRLKSKVTRVSLHVTQRAPMRTNQAFLSESLSDAIHQQKAGHSERDGIRPGKSLGKFNGRSLCRQSDLKATTARETAGLIDTLSARLGRDRVTGIRMMSDPLPENSFRSFPLTGQSRQGITRSAGQTAARPLSPTQRLPSPADVLRRPLVLLSDSLDLDPLYDSPLLSCQSNRRSSAQSLPVKFRLHGTTYVVTQWNGPERIETGWWNGPQHRRDYYRVATDRGQTWWVYRVIVRNGTASDLNVGSGSSSRINSRTKPHAANRTEQWRLHGLFS